MSEIELQNLLLAEFNYDSDSECDNSFDKYSTRIDVNFEYITGLRKNSILIWVDKEKCLYYKNSWNSTLGAMGCTCYDQKCKKRIYIREDDTAFTFAAPEHRREHGSMYETYKSMYCFNLLKKKCLTAAASMPPRKIYEEVVVE